MIHEAKNLSRKPGPVHSGLPASLVTHSGLRSGYMLAQYTAAALVSENRVLCHPASVDNVPSGTKQEDHVSMGAHRAVRAVVPHLDEDRVVAADFAAGLELVQSNGILRAVREAIQNREVVPS